MKKILVLGHRGMLGNAVHKYFCQRIDKYTVLTIDKRWPDNDFQAALKATDTDIIINCIGIIPQKNPPQTEYKKINIELPTFLDSLGKKIIHPSTDCEFSGNLEKNKKYKKIVKKVLTKLFEGGIVILVLKERAKQKKKTLKNKLTKKNNFDKLKKVKK